MSDQDELLKLIKSSPLSKTTKDFFGQKVKREGATVANIMALNELLKAVQFQTFAKLDADDNPKLKQVTEKFAADLKQAGDELKQDLSRIEAQAKRVSKDIQEDLKTLEELVVNSAKAEA